MAAEVREGRGESLLGDYRRVRIRGMEECWHERYIEYYLNLMPENVSSLHYRYTPSLADYMEILSSCWAFHGVPDVKPISTRSKSLVERWCSDSYC